MSKYSFNELLSEIAKGKREIIINFPDAKPFKGLITNVELVNTNWKPIKIKVITRGLTITDQRIIDVPILGEKLEDYQRPYTSDWIKVEFITNIDYETEKQIELPL